MYVIVWEYTTAHPAEFERAYGADGAWAGLFREARGYVRTDLLRDAADATRYVTHDLWDSEDSFRAFHRDFRERYEALDRECEALTTSERRVGAFSAS